MGNEIVVLSLEKEKLLRKIGIRRTEPYSIAEDLKDFIPVWDLALEGYLNYLGDTDEPNRPRAKFALTPKAEDYLEDLKEIPE